jgi:hypothetical protein
MKKVFTLLFACVAMTMSVQAQSADVTGLNESHDVYFSSDVTPMSLGFKADGSELKYDFSFDGTYAPTTQPGEVASLILDKFAINYYHNSNLVEVKDQENNGISIQYKVYEGTDGSNADWEMVTPATISSTVTYTVLSGVLVKQCLAEASGLGVDIANGLEAGKTYTVEIMAQVMTAEENAFFFPGGAEKAKFTFTKKAGGLRGDVNGDGEVNTTDVTALYNVIFGTDTTTDHGLCDLNNDGEINTTDVTELYNIIFGTAV